MIECAFIIFINSTGQNGSSLCILRMTNTGNFIAVNKFTFSSNLAAYDLAMDTEDNIYLTGRNWDSITVINNDTITSYCHHDMANPNS
ncbi:MAG: hypothetical protein K8S16_02630 [Bacteroidales bacterium]|nr:hypothetical protein [Bacteroidales bacterium]